MIFKGNTAKKLLQQSLINSRSNLSKGFFFEENIWVAFDNSSRNCWVEEFDSEQKAICWLENFFDISDNEDFDALKLNNELIFIPKNGYLSLKIEKDEIIPKFYPFS